MPKHDHLPTETTFLKTAKSIEAGEAGVSHALWPASKQSMNLKNRRYLLAALQCVRV